MALKTEPFGKNIADAINNLRLDDTKVNTAYQHSQTTGNPHSTTKSDIGLENVDNTSDANKPVSTATQTALSGKVDKVSGKSLVSDSEITRLASVHNYDDTQLRSDLSIASSTTSTTITDSADGNIRNFVAYGKSGQGENPTPTSPQDILAWDGKVHTHGKNLFNSSFTEQTKSGVTCKNNGDGSFSIVGTAESNNMFTLQSNILLKPNTTYSLNSCNHTDDANRCYIDLTNAVNIGISITNGTIPRTFTLTDAQAQYPFKMQIIIKNGATFNDVFYPMLVFGSDASTFAPYHSSTADLGINLYGIKVASGGNYTDADGQQWKSDYIDLKKGVHGKWVDTTKIDTTEAINESWLLSSVVEEELTEEQISALRNLQTYADGTTIEYGTLNPFATIDYWKNTDNGQAVADVDAKINKLFALLSPATTSEPAQLLYAPTE